MARRTRPGPTHEDKLEALHAQLVDAVAELATSQGWARMLTAAARFHDYSPSNILLICAQRPDATRVAGIRTWNTLGRRVTKGEHGIAILAPCLYRPAPGETAATRPRPETSPATPPVEPLEPSANSPTARQLRGFKVVHVFDITQTHGEPLPDVDPAHLTDPGPDGFWNHLAGLIHDDGYRIERGPCGLGANGYTDFTQRVVRVREDVDPAHAVKTLAHELGHIRADHEHRFTDYATSAACRGQAEVEAESIAYLITAHAGLDSAGYSVPYLTSWSGGDAEKLRESMARVVTVAHAVTTPRDGTAVPRSSGPSESWLLEPRPVPAPTVREAPAIPTVAAK